MALFAFQRNPAGQILSLYNYEIAVVNLLTGKMLAKFPSKDLHTTSSYIMSGDGRHVATTSRKSRQSAVDIYSLATGKLLRRLPYEGDNFHLLEFANDNRWIVAIFRGQSTASVWDVETGEKLRSVNLAATIERHQAALSPGGRWLATFALHKLARGHEAAMYLYDLQTGEQAGRLAVSGCPPFVTPSGVAFSRDGQELSYIFNWGSLAEHYRLISWNLNDGSVTFDKQFSSGEIETSSPMHRTFEHLAAGWVIKGVYFVDRKSGKVHELEAGQAKERRVAPLATMVVGPNRILNVWEVVQDNVPTLRPVITSVP